MSDSVASTLLYLAFKEERFTQSMLYVIRRLAAAYFFPKDYNLGPEFYFEQEKIDKDTFLQLLQGLIRVATDMDEPQKQVIKGRLNGLRTGEYMDRYIPTAYAAVVDIAKFDNFWQPGCLVYSLVYDFISYRLTKQSAKEVRAELEPIFDQYPELRFEEGIRMLFGAVENVYVPTVEPVSPRESVVVGGREVDPEAALTLVLSEITDVFASTKSKGRGAKNDLTRLIELLLTKDFDKQRLQKSIISAIKRCQLRLVTSTKVVFDYSVDGKVAIVTAELKDGEIAFTVSNSQEG